MKFNLKPMFNKALIKAKKGAPTALIVAGTIGVGVSVIEFCKATLKAKPTIDNFEKKKAEIKKDDTKEMVSVCKNEAVELTKFYWKPTLILVASVGCIGGSHYLSKKRIAEVGALAATTASMFKEYRANVIEKYGEDVDKEMRFGIKKVKPKKGEEDTKTFELTEKTKLGIDGYSDYARFFDETSIYWEKDPDYCLTFLKSIENNANEKLKADGMLFLNDVYEALGLPKSKAGQVVGWVYDEKNPIGDNYVDFGLYNVKNSSARNFVNGIENVVLLDFNVDGDIFKLM